MKQYKILLSIILIFIMGKFNAQENENKKIQMGIILGSNLNINNTDTKLIKTNNPGYDFTIGMNLIKNFNQNLGFNTGIEFDFSSMKYTFQDSLYYDFKDNQIFSKSEKNTSETYSQFFLQERTQKPIYLTIPTMFIFKTDFIGYNRYFAKFGMRHNFVLKEMVTDKGILDKVNERMKISKDLAMYSGSIGISAGTEWNYSGSSSIQFEIGYYYGISNLQRGDALFGDIDKNKTLYSIDKTNAITYHTIKSSRNQLALKISFLF
jgi:hypothetical protein